MNIDISKLRKNGLIADFEDKGKGDGVLHIHLNSDDRGTMIRDMVDVIQREYHINDAESDLLHGDLFLAIEKTVILHAISS